MTIDGKRVLDVEELKAHLSSVLEEVVAGAIFTITRHGHALARITPIVKSPEADRAER